MSKGKHTSQGPRTVSGWWLVLVLLIVGMVVLVVAGTQQQDVRDQQGSCVQEHLKDPSVTC